jgi:hypothetical protein
MPELSGASWVPKFPGSNSVTDLEPTFRANVQAFIAALDASGASRPISATFRPAERAYLMHWSWRIVKEHHNAQAVPAMAGVDIQWWHGTQAASEAGAQEMVTGYLTGGASVAPALNSRHTQRKAIDMSVSWSGNLTIQQKDGSSKTITSLPRSSTNADLIQVAATYGVIHFNPPASDPPHWSTDGH